jgi:hypothetical protein
MVLDSKGSGEAVLLSVANAKQRMSSLVIPRSLEEPIPEKTKPQREKD